MKQLEDWLRGPFGSALVIGLILGVILWPKGQQSAAFAAASSIAARAGILVFRPIDISAGALVLVLVAVFAIGVWYGRARYNRGWLTREKPSQKLPVVPASSSPPLIEPERNASALIGIALPPVSTAAVVSPTLPASSGIDAALSFQSLIQRMQELDGRFLELREFRKKIEGTTVEWDGFVRSIMDHDSGNVSIGVGMDMESLGNQFWADIQIESVRARALALRKGDKIRVRGQLESAKAGMINVKDAEFEILR